MMGDYQGYRTPALEVLEKYEAQIWSDVTITTDSGNFDGLILPRSETADEKHIVIKMITGYNVGLLCDKITDIKINGRREANYKIPEKEFPYTEGQPRVKLFGTGGTIASRLDYRTGAVIPAFSPGELYGSVPELADICNLETEKLYGVFSENIGHEEWIGLANAIGAEIEKGVDGIVVGHGTDTMHHTAAALSFMVQDSPVPIVMVGSQRSSDRPSSDAAINLINATRTAATSDIAEVMVCMFGPTSDQYGLLHRGTRVRKMHSSYRSTFRTLSDIPLAMIDKNGVKPLKQDYKMRRPDNNVKITPVFDDRVSLVYYYPGMKPDIIDSLIANDYKGIVIAGTGLGHVNRPLYDALDRANEAGVAVYMTVQTLWGFVQMYVYETGRELMGLGVVPTANMLPEVAYVKLGWALGQTDDLKEVEKIMLSPVSSEITEREPHNGYLLYQGGIPEVEEFTSRNWK
ncbi:MAG: Glu-tRNA(Gln) amidotransferase subunit GatD [bacterium]|nr:Glu-tRNA(Gln) amidotransferase subunit GatD [bacterium]MCP4800078.1 Glu-tRNA(Gln) amidotransferase subunit GatD [bacterium]